MSTIDFQLARLTAQTAGVDSTRVQGDHPEFTKAFIAQAAGQIKPMMVYHAIMAYYVDDAGSIDELNLKLAEWCWCRLFKRHQERAYRPEDIVRVAELAILFYLNPIMEETRSIKACAAWTRVKIGVWESKYSKQRDVIVNELANMKADGASQLRSIMRDEDKISLQL